ncbi:MAG: hypothetical protein ACI4JT_04445 [Oscillospiraceae bacterium]
MFCEKCGAQIPDGAETMCANCRARFGGVQSAQPVQPNYGQPVQPVQQPAAPKADFSLETITGNPMLMMVIKLALGAISLWAAFGPLLAYITMGNSFLKLSFSFMGLHAMAGSASPQFVPVLILMILSILLALVGIALTILPKVAPQVKLPLPSYAASGATAGALLLSIISQFITIGFVASSKGAASFSGFGVFMMVLSFLALGATVFLALPELKKK